MTLIENRHNLNIYNFILECLVSGTNEAYKGKITSVKINGYNCQLF